MEIRLLRADEIECRVQSVKENGFMLLLYKDARCDMKILDELFGVFGWQRKHEVINGNLFCTVSVYDKQTGQWIDKQDVGVESYTEKEKGQASDSFKRACFNIGIGRELYTSPFIWIVNQNDVKNYNGKLSVSTTFKVKEIGCDGQREIDHLVIVDNRGNERFRLNGQAAKDSTIAEKDNHINQDIPATPSGGEVKFYCSNDGDEISERVASYSKEKHGRALCMSCQKKEKR